MSVAYEPRNLVVLNDQGQFLECRAILIDGSEQVSLSLGPDDDESYDMKVMLGGFTYYGKVPIEVCPPPNIGYALVREGKVCGVAEMHLRDYDCHRRAFMFD